MQHALGARSGGTIDENVAALVAHGVFGPSQHALDADRGRKDSGKAWQLLLRMGVFGPSQHALDATWLGRIGESATAPVADVRRNERWNHVRAEALRKT